MEPCPGSALYGKKELAAAAELLVRAAWHEGVSVAIAGGLAMQFYGSPRLTADVDLVAGAVPKFVIPVRWLTFGGVSSTGVDGIPVDWIVRVDNYAGLYREALDQAVEIADLPVVSPEYLTAIKMQAGRGKDNDDLIYLLQQPRLVDRAAAKMIARRHVGGKFAEDGMESLMQVADWRSAKDERLRRSEER